jgi:hypothetical protein
MPYADRKDRQAYDRKRYRYQKKGEATVTRKLVFTMRLPDQFLAILQRLAMEGVAKGTNPWRTTQDVAKGLMDEGLIAIRGKYDTVDEFLPQLELEQQIANTDRARRSVEYMLAMTKKNIKAMMEIDAEVTALHAYSDAVEAARRLPRTIWRDWLISQLERTFPEFSRLERTGKVPGVSLSSRPDLGRKLRDLPALKTERSTKQSR